MVIILHIERNAIEKATMDTLNVSKYDNEMHKCACGDSVTMNDWYSHLDTDIHKIHKDVHSVLNTSEVKKVKCEIIHINNQYDSDKHHMENSNDIILYSGMKTFNKRSFRDTVYHILNVLQLNSKDEFNQFLKDKQISRLQFYRIVESYIPHKWDTIKSPIQSVSYWVQKGLKGYKICKNK